jgi:TonB family protein
VAGSLIVLWIAAMPLSAQVTPEIENVARRAAEKIAKTHHQRIFVFSHLNCELDLDLCTAFEDSFRDNIEKLVPGVQFVRREDAVSLLSSHGFIKLDMNVTDVLVPIASEAGAEVVVTDTISWLHDGIEFLCDVIDARTQNKIDQIKTKIVRTVPDFGGKPLLIRDPDTGISSIIYSGKPSGSWRDLEPHCDKCQDPSYTPAARKDGIEGEVLMIVTVTEQGTAENIGVLRGLKDGLTERAAEAVRSWQFKPAIGPDGKPIKVRVPIQMKFSLHG